MASDSTAAPKADGKESASEATAKASQPEDKKSTEQEQSGSNAHDLQTAWSLYYDKKLGHNANLGHFKQNLKKVGKFSSVESFWKLYRWFKDPDDMPKDHNVFMFRNDDVPAWETYPRGGAWIIKVRKRNTLISRLWEELLFAVIGEHFEEPAIAGCVLSTRSSHDNISVWISDSSPNIIFPIGEKLKLILNLDQSTQVEWKPFNAAIQDGSSYRNTKAYVYAAQPAEY